ncbi:MAG: phosphoglucosamine mutase [Fimbriimonadaceae bacterium]|nr:phosphoglucosamine mutase [Fimbriimonadaceae bacterium]
MAQGLFGTDGIRGVAGQFPVDCEGAYRLGRIVAQVLAAGAGEVLVGRDSRPSGRLLTAALGAGLCDGGGRMVDLGVVPTPAVAWAVADRSAAAGVAISASHNPAADNGFKLFGAGGEKLPVRLEARLAAIFETPAELAPTSARGAWRTDPGAAARYVGYAVSTFPGGLDLRGLTIVVDAAHGATGWTTPAALRQLGATVVPLACDLVGEQINAGCGSLHPGQVAAAVRACGATLGLAHDGDGDRLVLVDERGEVVDGDRILGLTAHWLQRQGALTGGRVVGTILSNSGLERWLCGHGLTFHRAAVGDRNVWTMMRQHNADLGGEPSGHTIVRRLSRTDDALLTALQVLALVVSSGRTLHELAQRIELLPQHSLDLPVGRQPEWQAVAPVARAVAAARATLGAPGRVVVRYSGTEPVARILAEGPQPAVLQAAVAQIADGFRRAGLAT